MGAASNLDLVISQNQVKELETAVRLIEQKINIRRQFVAGQIDEPMAELRLLEAEAEQRRFIALPKLELAIECSVPLSSTAFTSVADGFTASALIFDPVG